MQTSFIYRWTRRTGWVIVDLSKKCTSYFEKLPKFPTPKLELPNLIFDRPIKPIPGTRRATHKHRSKRPTLHDVGSCLSEQAAIAISIGYENKRYSPSILAHSINMALCKDSFTGNMRSFNYDEAPSTWEVFLSKTSHVWSPEFSAFLRRKGRRMPGLRRSEWVEERSYRGWTELVVSNLLEFFEMERDGYEGLGRFEPMAGPREQES